MSSTFFPCLTPGYTWPFTADLGDGGQSPTAVSRAWSVIWRDSTGGKILWTNFELRPHQIFYRTISTSEMRGSRSGYLSVEENEEPEEEARSNTISNIETVIHLVKGNIGKHTTL